MSTVNAFIANNLYIVIAAGMMLVAMLILIFVLTNNKKKKDDAVSYLTQAGDAPLPEGVFGFAANGKTAETNMYGDATVDESVFDEKTVAAEAFLLHLSLRISFDGRVRMTERAFAQTLTLGRGEKCDVDVVFGAKSEDARQTSREHAMLILREDGLYVRDCQSRNGTALNGRELDGEALVRSGDELRLGKASVQIRLDGQSML